MTGILQILKDNGFQCYDPSAADPPINVDDEPDRRPVYRPFETPAPKKDQMGVEDPRPGAPLLFRYFLDGSMRTTNAGHVVDVKQRYLPIFIAQVGVATTRLDNARIALETYSGKNILFLPETFSTEDTMKARRLVAEAARTSRMSLELELECYSLLEDEAPIAGARKKVLSTMHDMEIGLIKQFAESGKVMPESLLMIDGSLQFYGNLERVKEAFRNVVGVAKSFDLNQRLGTGPNREEVGALIARLRHRYRTPARKILHRNLTIGAWYLRLHSSRSHEGLATSDGVVKLEVFPDDATGSEPVLDTDRCNRISSNVLALRHPGRPNGDSGRSQIRTGRLTTHAGGLFDPTQRPSKPPQCNNLLSLFCAQDIAHADGASFGFPSVSMSRAYLCSLAGFQVTTIGRFWVTAEDRLVGSTRFWLRNCPGGAAQRRIFSIRSTSWLAGRCPWSPSTA